MTCRAKKRRKGKEKPNSGIDYLRYECRFQKAAHQETSGVQMEHILI